MSGIAREIFRDGKKLGREEGREEGIQEGMQRGILSNLVGLVKDGIIECSLAAKRVNMTETEFKKLLV